MKHPYRVFAQCVFILLVSFFSAASLSHAANIVTAIEYAQNGASPVARISVSIAPPYHAYAHKPGTTGKPTVLHLTALDGPPVRATVRYPRGQSQRDIFTPSQTVQVYEGTVNLFVSLAHAQPGQAFTARLEALLCSDKHCLPVNHLFSLLLPTSPLPALRTLPWASAYDAALPAGTSALTASPPPAVNAVPLVTGNTLPQGGIATAFPSPTTTTSKSPTATTTTTPLSSIPAAGAQGTALAPLPLTSPDAAGMPAATAASGWNFTPRYFAESAEVTGILKAVLLGLLAGLILNAMPCVLPVLTMKVSAFLLTNDEDPVQRKRHFREHCLLFAAGIMTLFVFLALVLGTAGMIWGQLFQNIWVVMGMLTVIFLLGLSMLGVFTLPVIDLKAAQSTSPRLQAYLTGIIATLLATPCSGPLLGGVLGWAFTQPLASLIAVFVAVGLGMSSPYLLFALRPQIVTILPKPGAWMGVMEILLGFFLMGTSLYLLSILPSSHYIPVLCVLLVLALCAWLYGRYASYDATPRRRWAVIIGSALALVLVSYVALWPASTTSRWESFSPTAFAEMLGREPMVVEFTADWCPNCKLLEQSTLTPTNVARWQDQYGVRFIRVDLTREDPIAQDFLRTMGSSSIPLTALFPVGKDASSPLILRDIYSTISMDAAMAEVFSDQKAAVPYGKNESDRY